MFVIWINSFLIEDVKEMKEFCVLMGEKISTGKEVAKSKV